ncbi:hypothetical protein VW098_04720 [Phaeobacter sp. JH57H2]
MSRDLRGPGGRSRSGLHSAGPSPRPRLLRAPRRTGEEQEAAADFTR